MTRSVRFGLPLVLSLALMLAPASASGAAKQTRTLDVRARLAAIAPITPTGATLAGDIRGRPIGLAAIIVKSRTSPHGTTAEGSTVLFARKGTLKATIRNQIQPQPDGSTRYPGSFRVTGGSGAYKGARGSGSFDGVIPAGDTVFTFEVGGKLRF
jgi:hypothetical protein